MAVAGVGAAAGTAGTAGAAGGLGGAAAGMEGLGASSNAAASGLGNVANAANGASGPLGNLKNVTGGATGMFKQLTNDVGEFIDKANKLAHALSDRWIEMQDIAFKSARTMAMSREMAMRYDRQLMQSTKELARQYGISAKEIADFQKSYGEATGRNIILTKRQIESMAALSKITDEATATQLIDEFDKLGIGIEASTAKIGLMQERAKALGINATKATKTFADNIRLAASYSFKNGVNDIEKMSMKAVGLRMEMRTITSAMDRFMNIEDAITTSARLQMLGGSFGAMFSNPMGAMYEAMADPAAFQERLVKMLAGKGTYDAKTGQVGFDPVTMMQIREAAKQLGVSVDELTNPAMASVQNQKVQEELERAGTWGNWSKEQQQAIMNLSRNNVDIETGKHIVTWLDENGDLQKKAIEELSEEELKIAQDRQMSEEGLFSDVQEIKDILKRTLDRARGTTSMKENIEGLKEEWNAMLVQFQNLYMPLVSGLFNGKDFRPWDWIKGLSGWFGDIGFGAGSTEGPSLFAEGGIVKPIAHAQFGTIIPGHSRTGDKTPVLANAGEMILNGNEQKRLFDLLSLDNNNSKFNEKLKKLSIESPTITINGKTTMNGDIADGGLVDNLKSASNEIRKASSKSRMASYKVSSSNKSNNGTIDTDRISNAIPEISDGYKTIGGALLGSRFGLLGAIIGGVTASKIGATKDDKSSSKKEESDSKKSKETEKSNAFGKLGKITGNFGGFASGALIGSRFGGPVGALAGAILGSKMMGGIGGTIGGVFGGDKKDKKENKDTQNSKKEESKKSSEEKETSNTNKAKAKGSGGFGLAGGITGAMGGALVGSRFGGPVGAIAGALIGGGIGSGIGSLFGRDKDSDEEEVKSGNAKSASGSKKEIVRILKSIDSKMPVSSGIASRFGLPSISPVGTVPMMALEGVGKLMKVLPTEKIINNSSQNGTGNSEIKLNVSGTIRLEGGNNSVELDINKLLDTPEFRRKLTDIISNRLNETSNAGKKRNETVRNNTASIYDKNFES